MRVLICGSRGWHDPFAMEAVLAGLDVLAEGAGEKVVIIHGGARKGADKIAHQLAGSWRMERVSVEADWGRYGKVAGFKRNQQMLDEYHPDVVFAFRADGKSNGTDDMIARARAAGLPTYVISGGPQGGPDGTPE